VSANGRLGKLPSSVISLIHSGFPVANARPAVRSQDPNSIASVTRRNSSKRAVSAACHVPVDRKRGVIRPLYVSSYVQRPNWRIGRPE